jgi:hypothetical protein
MLSRRAAPVLRQPVGSDLPVGGRHGQQVAERFHRGETDAQVAEEAGGVLVMRFTGPLGLGGGETGRHDRVKVRQLAQVVVDAGGDQAALEPLEKDDVVAELHDGALEGIAHGAFDGVGELGLAVELLEALRELDEAEALLAGAFLGREVEEGEHVGVHDLEDAGSCWRSPGGRSRRAAIRRAAGCGRRGS